MFERDYVVTMCRYNTWMNERLYALCSELSDEERTTDRGAFFGSIHGTLNHLLWADTLWLARLRGQPLPDIGGARTILHESFDDLRQVRARTDQELLGWAEHELDERTLKQPLSIWVVSKQARIERDTWVFVAQLFNHQAHHRGQITTLLSQRGKDIGITDLPWAPPFMTEEHRS